MMRIEGGVLLTAGCIVLGWLLWQWTSNKAPAGPASSKRKHRSRAQHAAAAVSSDGSVAASSSSNLAVQPRSKPGPSASQLDEASSRAPVGCSVETDEYSSHDSSPSSPSSSVHAELVLLEVLPKPDSTSPSPTPGDHPASASGCLTADTSPASSSSSSSAAPAPSDGEQAQPAAGDAKKQPSVGLPAAAQAAGKQTSPVAAAGSRSPGGKGDSSRGAEGAQDAPAPVVLPQQQPAGVDGTMLMSTPTSAAPSAPPAAPTERRLPNMVSVPKAVQFFIFWVQRLAVLGRGMVNDTTPGKVVIPLKVLVRHALWPTAARSLCFSGVWLLTLTGVPLPGKPGAEKQKLPTPGKKWEMPDAKRIAYTRMVWTLRVLTAGLWQAAQKALPGQVEVCLDLTAATLRVLLPMTWRAYRPPVPGQAKQLLKDTQANEWAPDWELGKDVVGWGADGQPVSYFLHDLVTQESDLQDKVVQQQDGGAWLVAEYENLVASKGEHPDYHRFLRVDAQQQRLVVDLRQLHDRVGGWALSAHNTTVDAARAVS